MVISLHKNIENKWRKKWDESKIFESNPDDREKLFLTVAYPYPSGAMHIGHGRTYTVPDVYARFKRMQGKNVLFPMAWHVTGAPVIGIADRIKRKDPWTLDLYERVHGVPKDTLPKLEDPEYIVKYFSTEYHEVMDEMGYSIDWRREFRTIDPTYRKFIEWQITTLYEKGLVAKGEHPVKYCPHDENPVGDHDLLEGEGVGVNELTLLKFKIDDKVLVTATLRPETIVGATNIWLNPDVEYVLVDAEGENWVITKEAHYNLQHQIKDLKIISEINPNDLIGKMATNPFNGDELPIFPASFVSASYGSGVVFSEPADAPADYIALQDLKNNDELIAKYNLEGIIENVHPIPVCTLKGYGEIPAADIIERLGITNQNDEKLHEATNELYKQQHSKGKIIDSIPGFGGMKVRFAREELKKQLINDNMATIMYDFAERPVVCRCGNNCVVKIMDDQWFMKYGDEEWTEKTLEVLDDETIIPKEIKNNFEYYINWLDDWACSRKVGLGTRLPWDNQWLIEPLTDSTLYMSYYTIAKYLRNMNPDDLNKAFFDKVFLNKDSDEIIVPEDKVKEIQSEFNYWYPLDWRLSAKDLVGNHLSFLMFTHSAIYPKAKWPKGTVVFGMGLLEGNKMSSSKGNVILLKDAIQDYTADVVRLFLMASAEPWQDFDWREKEVLGTKRRLEWFIEFAAKVEEIKGSKLDLSNIEKVELTRTIDLWMISQLNQHIKNATDALEVFQTRQALQHSLFLLKKDVDHYLYRVKHLIGSENSEITYVLSTVLEAWIKLLAPFTPHTCEELWEKYGGEGFISLAPWPEYDENLFDEKIQKSEEIVQGIITDINEIRKIISTEPKKIHLYLAPEWKWSVFDIANEVGKPDIGQIMGRSIKAEVHSDKKEIADFAKKISREMTRINYVGHLNEKEILEDAKDHISKEVSCEVIIHEDANYDPENKARNAIPYKPAIYME